MKIINQISAGGIVFKNGLWLVGQHSQHKGWVFLKGLVGDKDSKESMEQAALREVEEEGGIKARIIDKNPVKTSYQYEWQGKLINKTVYYFLMEYVSGDPKNHDFEMTEVKFVSKEEILKILTYPSDIKAFTEILKRL